MGIIVQIIKKVQVKQIVTEKSKAKLYDKFRARKLQLEQECQQLLFEQKKLQHKPGVAKHEVVRRFQQEIKQRKEAIQLIDFKIEQLDILQPGSELVESEVEALVEVTVGADWEEIMKDRAIIVKDNKVVRID